jgi:hypothetical protein
MQELTYNAQISIHKVQSYYNHSPVTGRLLMLAWACRFNECRLETVLRLQMISMTVFTMKSQKSFLRLQI